MPTRQTTKSCSNILHYGRVLIVAMGLAIAPTGASLAQDGPGIVMGDTETGPQMSTADEMRALAAEQGSVRVIVGLDMEFKTEGQLDATATDTQRATISSRQDSMLSRLATPDAVTRFETIPYIAMTLTSQDLDRVLDMPGISSVELDIAVPPNLNDSTGLVNAPRLWRQGAAGSNTSVAILDTGVRPNHRAFRSGSGRDIIGSACFSSTVPGQSTTLCPNGNDQMKRRKWARAGRDCDTRIAGCGHGTHVAAIAAGKMWRNHGMARDANIVPIQVFSEFTNESDCRPSPAPCVLSYTSDQVKGLEQVMKWRNRFNIAAVNMSLGGGSYTGPCDDVNPSRTAIIENLRSVKIATVASSGNRGSRVAVGAPSCISAAISAGSTTKQDELSSFSNHAPMVKLLAPGSSIRAADADGRRRALTIKSGTSMSAPHIAGAFAMLKSHKSWFSVDRIERALVCSGETVTENDMPKPRINMAAALEYVDKPDTKKRWNFRNSRQVNQWSHIRGNWRNAGRKMVVSGGRDEGWKVAKAPFCADNIKIRTVMARKDPTQPAATAWASGVAISGEADVGGGLSGLYFLYYPRGDHLDAAIWEFENKNADTDTGRENKLCSNTRALGNIDAHGKLRLKVVKRGNSLRFVINGTVVCTGTTDTRYSNGHVKTVMFAPDLDTRNHKLKVFNLRAKALFGPKKGWEEQNTPASMGSSGTSGGIVFDETVGSGSSAAVIK